MMTEGCLFCKLTENGLLTLRELERAAIIHALRLHNGIQRAAAIPLGVTPRVMSYKIKVLGINVSAVIRSQNGEKI